MFVRARIGSCGAAAQEVALVKRGEPDQERAYRQAEEQGETGADIRAHQPAVMVRPTRAPIPISIVTARADRQLWRAAARDAQAPGASTLRILSAQER
jgi:hypothetical protein